MRTFAYCAASFEKSVAKAAGVKPYLSPPLTMTEFDPFSLEGYDLLYFKLHGLPGQPFWYGDNWTTAISAEQIRTTNLHNAVVFVANCNLWLSKPGDPRKNAPILLALLQAGARAVIGGPGENYAKADQLFGADQLGRHFCRALRFGFTPSGAFKLAHTQFEVQVRIKFRSKKTTNRERMALKDTLEFRIFEQDLQIPGMIDYT